MTAVFPLLRAACVLDTFGAKIYSAIMFRKFVAASFVAIWLALLGIEFSEDTGLIDYDEPEMDRRVEATLAGLGEAIKISDDIQVTVSCPAIASPIPFEPSMNWHVCFQSLKEVAGLVKVDIPIYKLCQAFLI